MYPDWVLKNHENHTESLEERLIKELADRKYTIATAESCTGGLIAGTLVNVAGASDVLHEGYITYSNEAKERLVGVYRATLQEYGAVSAQTAKEMAEGAARSAGAEVALSSTGIAGPGGGTKEKPVGLVYVGCYVCGHTAVARCEFKGDRMENRLMTVEKALSLALEELKTMDP